MTTTTPIFDALYREHRNAGMAYPAAPVAEGSVGETPEQSWFEPAGAEPGRHAEQPPDDERAAS